MPAPQPPACAPAGWTEFALDYGFAHSFGQVYFREQDQKTLLLGFRCSERHMNPVGFCHGGAIAAFADYAALAAQYELGLERIVSPTVTLSVDFLQGIRLAAWVEARTTITHLTGKMCFTNMESRVDGQPVMASRAIFKLSSASALTDHPFYLGCARLWPHKARR